MVESEDRPDFPSRPGSGRCHSALGGGRQRQFLPAPSYNARSSPPSSSSTAIALCLLSPRFVVSFLFKGTPLIGNTVLATPYNFPLLRPPVPRSRLPCLLPDPILKITGRVIRSLTRAFLMAVTLRNDMSHLSVAFSIDAIPRTPALFHTRLYMVAAQSRHAVEFPRVVGLHSSILALGLDGVQLGTAWHGTER
jgi:hypothetical protein